MNSEKLRLGDLLIKYELINEDQLNDALKAQKVSKNKLGEVLIEGGYITEDDLFWTLANKFELPYINLNESMVDIQLISIFPEDMIKAEDFLPLVKFGNELTVCIDDPTNTSLINKIKEVSQCEINLSLGSYSDLRMIKEKIIARWEGKEINYERALDNFFEVIDEGAINRLIKDETMSNLILFIFDEIIKNSCDSATIIHTDFENRVFFNFRGLRTLKMKFPASYWLTVKEKLEELQRVAGGTYISLSRDVNYNFTMEEFSENALTISNIHKVHKITDIANLGLTKEQKIIIDNILPFMRGLCVFTSKDKALTRKLTYNLLHFYDTNENIILKLDKNAVIQGFDNVIELETGDERIKSGDFDVLIADESLIDLEIIAHILEQGKLVFLISHAFSSRQFIDFIYTKGEIFSRILPHIKIFITSVIVPKLCDACKVEVQFSLIPKDLFSFYKDIKFFAPGKCDQCKKSGFNGFKEFNELLYVDENIKNMLKENVPSEDIFNSLKNAGFVGIREKLFELAKSGEIPYNYLI
ncbi:hypothetical protein KAI78_05015 [bacterium]|nr:hypothetical protein [bacterium]